jgi:hypothetical protein
LNLRIEKLTDKNFADYESLTSCEAGGCYCAFWHGKWKSVEEWDARKKEKPLENRELIRMKVGFGFHVGVVVYEGNEAIAWVSVGPLPDTYWTWKRVAKLGTEASSIAGITCITVAKERRSQKMQPAILRALTAYGKEQGWTAIEGYPFEEEAYAKHGKAIAWPGNAEGFRNADFEKIEPHWLSQADYPRAIYRKSLD